MFVPEVRGRRAELLKVVGYCGEFPMELLGHLDGYRDYNRRLITEMVDEDLLKERKFVDGDRHVVRSLSLTQVGLEALKGADPTAARNISDQILAPPNGQGNWKKTLRLHRNAHCLVTAMNAGAIWEPGREKDQATSTDFTYWSIREMEWFQSADSKGSRASGAFLSQRHVYPVYYLGSHNMLWNNEIEKNLFSFLPSCQLNDCDRFGGCILIGKTWDFAERLLAQGTIPNTRLIPVKRGSTLYYLTDDRDGMALLRSLLLDNPELRHYTREFLCPAFGSLAYQFDLGDLVDYYRRRRQFLPPSVGRVFPFQMEAMEKINKVGAELIPLPMELLDDYYDQGDNDEQLL